jgi:predicted RNA binding protein YcfA (HicA-like mRNA interferase family)
VRLPRDISGRQLAKALTRLGYEVSHQTGSHMRLTTTRHGEHHVTVPAHGSLRVGMLGAILRDVSEHHGLTRDQLVGELFE